MLRDVALGTELPRAGKSLPRRVLLQEQEDECRGEQDGVAYLPGEEGSRDMCILEADGEEGLWLAEFDLELLRSYRRQEVHGNAYRRPELYGLLTEDTVRPPFVRKDRRRPVL